MWALDTLRGFVNTVSGLGTARDKAVQGAWSFQRLDRQQLEAAYRSNWIARKAVDVPAFDMMREGWSWQGDGDTIERIEAEEKRLNLRHKIHMALRWSRLYGGAALIMSDGAADPSEPLDVSAIGLGGLRYVQVIDRAFLSADDIDDDPASDTFLQPRWFNLVSTVRGHFRLHHSRVISFLGRELPLRSFTVVDWWGDSVLDAIEAAIRDAEQVQRGISALVQEAKIDVIKVPDLTMKVSTQEMRDALQARFDLAGRLKSVINTLVLDAEEDYEQKQLTFSELPNVLRLYLSIVSGAADIPATRFLGQSPDGMNATGESDLRNYYDRLKAEQELVLRPRIEPLYEAVVRSALGDYPSDVRFEFNPLWQLSDKERAEVNKLDADAMMVLANSGVVPAEVLEAATRNRMIEGGYYPGIEAAYEEFDALAPEIDTGADGSESEAGGAG